MERIDMSTATLTHRIPKESLTVKPVITFQEAAKKINALVDGDENIQDACRKVFNENTVKMMKLGLGNYQNADSLRNAVYGYMSRLRKRARERRTAKKTFGKENQSAARVATETSGGDYKAFYMSVRGIMDMPLSSNKKVEVIRAIL